MNRSASYWMAMILVVIAIRPSVAGPAVNQFEVKDLDIEQGEVEIEDQSDWTFGDPRRKFAEPENRDLTFDDNEVAKQRHSIEMGLGLTDWLKLGPGFELEEERVDDPASFAEANDFVSLKVTEIQFEGVAVLVPVKSYGVGLGLFAEMQVPVTGEAKTFYVGPIIQAVSGPWSATANLAFVKFFGGDRQTEDVEIAGNTVQVELPIDDKWDFAYFTQLKYQNSDTWAFAVEAYGTLDRIGSTGNPSAAARLIGDQDQHRIGPVAHYTFKLPGAPASGDGNDAKKSGQDDGDDAGSTATVSVGALFGLNDNTPDTTLKAGIEFEF